jgi:hypothetical protein
MRDIIRRSDLEVDTGQLDVANAYEQPSCEREVSGFTVECSRHALNEYANSKSDTIQDSM